MYPASVERHRPTASAVDLIDADGRCFAIQLIGTVGGTTPVADRQDPGVGRQLDLDRRLRGDVHRRHRVDNVQTITFDRTKRYVRYVRTVSGTSPTFPLGGADRGAEEDRVTSESG